MGKKNPIQKIQDEARESYNLADRLRGIARRTRTVTVYTDEITGEKLGGVETVYAPGTKVVIDKRRWGVRGEQDALRERIKEFLKQETVSEESVEEAKAEAAKLAREIKRLEGVLKKTSHEITLTALPELVMKDARRKAFRNLGLKRKSGLTPEQDEDVQEEYLALVLSSATTKWIDRAEGEEHHDLPLDDARAFKQFLLPEEWAKLEGALDELQAKKAIGDAGTDDLDF